MDLMSSSFLAGDPRMVDQIVYELKSQGIFDQFRKECIADVDTKPAYQNLRQRVEGSVMNFLKKRKFASDTNKNQLREQLRKNITESGFLESGVERIVDQVVNPKISSIFLPKVEEVVYRFLGIQKPESASTSQDDKVKTEDLLPTDLEAVSPESVHETSNVSATELSNENIETTNNETNNTSVSKTDDESPPFEPLEENTKLSMQEDNSVDSHYSGASGNDSILGTGNQSMDISENSQINGNSNVASQSEDTKMDICDNTMASENSDKLEIVEEPKSSEQKSEEKPKSDSKKSHDKYKSSKSDKHSKEDCKDKKERSKSESKSKDTKEKSSSKHSSSKDKKEEPTEKEFNLEKYKIPKKEEKDHDKNKDGKKKSEKSSSKDHSEKEKSGRERTKSERDRHDKERSSSHKSKERSSSSSKKEDKDRKHREERDDKSSKDKNSSSSKSSSSRHKESSSKDRSSKDKPKSSSSSKDKTSDSKKSAEDAKSSKRDKQKGHETSSKKEKEKSVSDDHYSFKNKKRERRSTDRDSNDGSGKTNRNDSLVDSTSENSSKSSKKGTSENFSSGGDSSSNSDKVENKSNEAEEVASNTDVVNVQPIKYIKPKFASNMEEAMKIMKIRKQLAKLERKNQLALSQLPDQTVLITTEPTVTECKSKLDVPATEIEDKPQTEDVQEVPVLKSQDLSMETFEALEARLAQEMSNIDDHMYGDEDDENYDNSSVSVNPVKKPKVSEEAEPEDALKEEDDVKVVKTVKFNGSFEKSALNTSDKENQLIENENFSETKRKVSEEFTGFTASEMGNKHSLEIMEKAVKVFTHYIANKTAVPAQESSSKLVTTPKTTENRLFIKLNKMDFKSVEIEPKQNGDISATEDEEMPCYFFEESLVSKKRLTVLNKYVVGLERYVHEGTLQIQNNVPHINKRALKRKLQGAENNNSLNCTYKPPTKRTHLSNANSNETVCNTSLTLVVDVSSHPDFSLPLSPAESEKSGENKKEEPVMVKPKRVSGSAGKRYSSADLYKPRPVLAGSSTRRRSARAGLNVPKP